MKERICACAVKQSDLIFYCEGVAPSELERLRTDSSLRFLPAAGTGNCMFLEGGTLVLKEWTKYKVEDLRAGFQESDFFGIGEFGTKSYGILTFKNCVGKSRFRDVPLLIQSDKISESEMERLLETVNGYILNLSYDFNTATFSSILRNKGKKTDLSYHKYLLLRNALTTKLADKNLFSLFHMIEADPHRCFVSTTEYVELSQCDTIADEAVEDIVSGNSQMQKCANQNNKLARRLKRGSQGYVPREIAVEETVDTFDNAENQFLRFFLSWAIAFLGAFQKRFAAYPNFNNAGLIKENELCIKKLKILLTQSFLRYVGSLHYIPMGSTVLTKKHGYKQIFQLFMGINALPEVDALQEDLQEVIENKSLAVLYENYCFFGMAEVLSNIYGIQLTKLKYKVQKTAFSKTLEKKTNSNYFEFAATAELPKVRIHYNKNYVSESYSKAYAPDVAIEIFDDHNCMTAIYLFDAKFKVNFTGAPGEERKSYQYDDISKMHTYRDAIRLARGAYILYPGTEDKIFYENASSDPRLMAGVGAFFVSPGKTEDWAKFTPWMTELLKCYKSAAVLSQ